MTNMLVDKLEALVDAHGMKTVLLQLEDICALKAEYVSANWQDEKLARIWDKIGKALDRAQAVAVDLP